MSNYKSNKTWREKNPVKWQKMKQRYYKQFEPGAHNSHQRYTTQEDNIIMGKTYPDRVIAGKIKRTVKAIQIRRLRLRREVQA